MALPRILFSFASPSGSSINHCGVACEERMSTEYKLCRIDSGGEDAELGLLASHVQVSSGSVGCGSGTERHECHAGEYKGQEEEQVEG